MSQSISGLEPRPIHELTRRLSGLIRGRLWLQVIVAMILGIATGVFLGPTTGLVDPTWSVVLTSWFALPGHIFLALIQMIVIPLVVASIILGMASSESMSQLRQTGVRTGLFFLLTTLAAVIIGLGVALSIQPGLYVDATSVRDSLATALETAPEQAAPAVGVADLPARISEMIPANPLQAGLEQNMMQVVVLALLIGIALVSMPRDRARPLLELLGAVQEVTMVVVRWAMYLAPFAVFGLLTQLVARLGLDAILGMGMYVLTVLLGLVLMLGLYLVLLRVMSRQRPLAFLRAVRDAQLLAFSTSSSAAVMPLTMQTAEERLGIGTAVARFVIPLGTTINMAGTALYQAVATVFLAQVFGVDLALATLVLIVFLAVGASIGSPGTPGIGIVILAMLLGTVGIPAAGIALILGVDRILDMCRTTINVTGDLVAASIMDRPESTTVSEPPPNPP